MRSIVVAFLILGLGVLASADSNTNWANESELGVIIVGGNADTKTTNFKQSTTYKKDKDQVNAKARYTEAEANGTTNAENWLVGARYDRTIKDHLAAYLSHDAESDRFAGFLQRDTTGLGLAYQVVNREDLKWGTELGYSRLQTDLANSNENKGIDGTRAFTKVSGVIKEGITGQLTAEYLYYFDDVPTTNSKGENYLINTEPSLSILLNNMFSLKLAYLVKYQNQRPSGVQERTDTTYSTTLVAKF